MKNDYINMEIEREHSRYPRGLKHKRKDTILENSLFDLELIAYKVIGIAKGQDDGKRNKTRSEEKGTGSAREILQKFLFGLLHEDGSTADGERADRKVEDRYCEIDEREREEHEEGDSKPQEETQTQKNED